MNFEICLLWLHSQWLSCDKHKRTLSLASIKKSLSSDSSRNENHSRNSTYVWIKSKPWGNFLVHSRDRFERENLRAFGDRTSIYIHCWESLCGRYIQCPNKRVTLMQFLQPVRSIWFVVNKQPLSVQSQNIVELLNIRRLESALTKYLSRFLWIQDPFTAVPHEHFTMPWVKARTSLVRPFTTSCVRNSVALLFLKVQWYVMKHRTAWICDSPTHRKFSNEAISTTLLKEEHYQHSSYLFFCLKNTLVSKIIEVSTTRFWIIN